VLCCSCEQANEVYRADLERNRQRLREEDAELEIGRLTRHINVLQENLKSEITKNVKLREDLNELRQVRQPSLSHSN
jgi:predicted RNase H-like nuclease (RuvC/YqgF family)